MKKQKPHNLVLRQGEKDGKPVWILDLVFDTGIRYRVAWWSKKPTDKQVRDARKIVAATITSVLMELDTREKQNRDANNCDEIFSQKFNFFL